jgi:hypothetical protein
MRMSVATMCVRRAVVGVAAMREATQRHDGESGAPCRKGDEVEIHD